MSCNNGCEFLENEAVLIKIREKGVSNVEIPEAFTINCECGNSFIMSTHESSCKMCNTIYAVTPCHNTDINSIVMVKTN